MVGCVLAFFPHTVYGWLQGLLEDTIHECRGSNRCRSVRPHTAGIETGISFSNTLVVLSRGQWNDGIAITESQHGQFWSFEEFLDHDFVAGVTKGVIDHDPTKASNSLIGVFRNENTFSSSETAGLEDHFESARLHMSDGFFDLIGFENTEFCGRDRMALHERL